jgi:uncharacterized membrane protein YhhN
MNRSTTLVVAVAASCLALVVLQLLQLPAPAAIAKLFASSAFVALALHRGALLSRFGQVILAGLALSWWGDMILIGGSQSFFLAGLAAFLLAHVAYVSAFVIHGYRRSVTLLVAAPVSVIAIIVWLWLAPHTPTDLTWPVRAYIAVISVMVIFAYGARGAGASWLVVAGASLFFLSDLSVAALRLTGTPYPTYVLGLPAYYAAQVCFALSVSQSRSH